MQEVGKKKISCYVCLLLQQILDALDKQRTVIQPLRKLQLKERTFTLLT